MRTPGSTNAYPPSSSYHRSSSYGDKSSRCDTNTYIGPSGGTHSDTNSYESGYTNTTGRPG